MLNPKSGKIWQIAYENNSIGFEIQQSTDVSSWQKIGFVKSQGNSHVISSYTFLDKKPLPGNNYYRLKQIDLDGASTYSKIVMAVFNRKGISFYPNPATKTITFNMKTVKTVDIYNIWGKKVLSREVASDLDISTLPSGVYVLDINRGEYRERLVVE